MPCTAPLFRSSLCASCCLTGPEEREAASDGKGKDDDVVEEESGCISVRRADGVARDVPDFS